MEWKITDINSFFYDIELKENLLSRKIDNVFFWKLIRFDLYIKLSNELKVFDEPHPKREIKRSSIKHLYNLVKRNTRILTQNALNGSYKKDILIFRSPRRTIIDNEEIDIYTHYIINEIIKAQTYSYEALEFTYNDRFIHNEKFAVGLYIPRLLTKHRKKINFLYEETELLDTIRNEIMRVFRINIDINSMVQSSIQDFKIRFNYYNKLFKKRSPKMIYLVCSYGLESIIAAAKVNAVEVIEIQHGTMSKYHLGYSFPNQETVPYFPDKILLFGEYWSDSTPLPLTHENRIIYGFPFLDSQIKKYKNNIITKNKIVFLSQGPVTNKLSEIAYSFAEKYGQFEIIYKLHPSEFDIWESRYPFLVKGVKLPNFKVIDNHKTNLYQLFAEAEYQVGVFSTAIFEGIAMGLKTVLINLPGIEEMEYLIKNNMVNVVDNENDLFLCLENQVFPMYNKEYFFKNTGIE